MQVTWWTKGWDDGLTGWDALTNGHLLNAPLAQAPLLTNAPSCSTTPPLAQGPLLCKAPSCARRALFLDGPDPHYRLRHNKHQTIYSLLKMLRYNCNSEPTLYRAIRAILGLGWPWHLSHTKLFPLW
eukprot:jgi/Mesvir1/4365/Mv26093-RA.1